MCYTVDGNCGFHACAIGLKIRGPDGWRQIRNDLLKEIDMHREFYDSYWGRNVTLDHERKIFANTKICDRQHWMGVPAHAQILANYYNIVFFSLTDTYCNTYLPCFEEAKEGFEKNIFGIALINNFHYVHVEFKPNSPLPPPTSIWINCHDSIANGWFTRIQGRIEA